MNRHVGSGRMIHQAHIDVAQHLAEQLMRRHKMIECSLYELNHGIGGVDLHRQLILIYAREIVETAQEFGEHIALVFGGEYEDKTA